MVKAVKVVTADGHFGRSGNPRHPLKNPIRKVYSILWHARGHPAIFGNSHF